MHTKIIALIGHLIANFQHALGLQIYSPVDPSTPVTFIETICGQITPRMIAIRAYMMELNFASNSAVTGQGYNITYRVQVPTNEGTAVFIKRFSLNTF